MRDADPARGDDVQLLHIEDHADGGDNGDHADRRGGIGILLFGNNEKDIKTTHNEEKNNFCAALLFEKDANR